MPYFTGTSAYVSIRQTEAGKAYVCIDYLPPTEDGTFARLLPITVTPEGDHTDHKQWLKDCLTELIENL